MLRIGFDRMSDIRLIERWLPSWTSTQDAGTSGGGTGGASRSTSRPSTGTRRGGRNSSRNGKAGRRQGTFPPAPFGGRRASGRSSPGAPQERCASRDQRSRFLGDQCKIYEPDSLQPEAPGAEPKEANVADPADLDAATFSGGRRRSRPNRGRRRRKNGRAVFEDFAANGEDAGKDGICFAVR